MSEYTVESTLADAHSISSLDAQLLLSHILECSRVHLIAWPEKPLTIQQHQRFCEGVAQLRDDYPLAYIMGKKEFWSLPLWVTPDVLVPRPETEHLVEAALACIPRDKSLDVLELATGSGAVACALASERPDIHLLATDISEAALKVARSNAEHLGFLEIVFRQSDWFDNISQLFDVIVSNPPYLAKNDPHLTQSIRYEPKGALVAGETGDECFRKIVQQARKHLKSGGTLLLEHGFEQATGVRALFQEMGYHHIETRNDLAGHPRITFAQLG